MPASESETLVDEISEDSVAELILHYGDLLKRDGVNSPQARAFLDAHGESAEFQDLAQGVRSLQAAAEERDRVRRAARRKLFFGIVIVALAFALAVVTIAVTSHYRNVAERAQIMLAESKSAIVLSMESIARAVPDAFIYYAKIDPDGFEYAERRVKEACAAVDGLARKYPPESNEEKVEGTWSDQSMFLWVRSAYYRARDVECTKPKSGVASEGNPCVGAFEDTQLNRELDHRLAVFLRTFPVFGAAYRYQGYYLYSVGRLEEAIQSLERAVELDASDFMASNSLAWFLYEKCLPPTAESVEGPTRQGPAMRSDVQKQILERARVLVEAALTLRVIKGTVPRPVELPLSAILDTAEKVYRRLGELADDDDEATRWFAKADAYGHGRRTFDDSLGQIGTLLHSLRGFRVEDAPHEQDSE